MKTGQPLVSVLFITYKRIDHLERALRAFRENTDYPNLEIVIADDGSGAEIQSRIRMLPADVFALAAKNSGLGGNNNNGLRHCTGKYVLMIQDDWQCQGPPDYLSNAVAVLEANPRVGIINFAGGNHPPDLTQPLPGSGEPCYVTPVPVLSNKEEFLYSDQPHLQSREALEFMGNYYEDRSIGRAEIDYSQRWERQSRFLTAVFPDYYMRVFSNEGEDPAMSFRHQELGYRVDRALLPIANLLKKNCWPLFKLGRASVRSTVALIEKMRGAR